MEEYDQLLYLDADTLIRQPFPEIWNFPVPLAAGRDVRKGFGWLPTFNAGVLLLKPNRRVLQHMLELAPTHYYETTYAEQGLLNGTTRATTTVVCELTFFSQHTGPKPSRISLGRITARSK